MSTRDAIAQTFIDVMIEDLEVKPHDVNLAGTFEDHLIFSMDAVYVIATTCKLHKVRIPKKKFRDIEVLDDFIDLIAAHVAA